MIMSLPFYTLFRILYTPYPIRYAVASPAETLKSTSAVTTSITATMRLTLASFSEFLASVWYQGIDSIRLTSSYVFARNLSAVRP